MFQWGAHDLIEWDVGKQNVIRISEEPLISGKVNKVHYIKTPSYSGKMCFCFFGSITSGIYSTSWQAGEILKTRVLKYLSGLRI